jgi:phage FluMu protein Com
LEQKEETRVPLNTDQLSFSQTQLHQPHPQPDTGHAYLKMRCPDCNKLYSVDSAWFQDPGPDGDGSLQFDCAACSTRFAAVLSTGDTPFLETFRVPEAAMEIPEAEPAPLAVRETSPAVPVVEAKCPKCEAPHPATAQECASCGLIFAKFKPVFEGMVGEVRLTGRQELVELWERVVANYEDEAMHDQFISACFDAEALAFASQKYGRVLAAAPQEEIAQIMKKKIMGLASFKAESRGSFRSWQFRLPGFNSVVMALGGAVMTLGLLLPNSNNLTGIGVAAIALGIGVRFFHRSPEL